MIPATFVIASGAPWFHGAVALLGDAFVKGSLVLLCSWAIVLVARRASAATRHLIWTLGVVSALLIPPLMYLLPAWRIALPLPTLFPNTAAEGAAFVITPERASENAGASTLLEASKQIVASDGVVRIDPIGEPVVSKVAAASRGNSSDWRTLAIVVWLFGVALSLSSLLFSMLRVRRLQRGSVPVTTGPCVAAVARVAARVGLARPPRVHVGDQRMMPMVWGLFRPVLLLPAGAARWSEAKLESVLLHELAHVRRRDALTQFIAEIARALYWFNPLVWLAARQLYIEREHACDDIVLNAGTRATDYAGELLDLVRSLRTTRATAMAAIAMARPSQLKVRLSAVLDDGRSRSTLNPRALAGASAAALLLILPLAAMRPLSSAADIPTLQLDLGRAQRQIEAGTPKHHEAPTRQTSTRGPQGQPVPVVASVAAAAPEPMQQQATCWTVDRRNTSISHHTDTDDELQTVKWTSGRCSGSVRMEGRVRMNGDFSGIASISSGGLFRIEEDDSDTDRRLVIKPSNGQLVYEYRVDGRDREFDAAGRAWLSSALLNLFRTTAFAADERIDYMLRTKGPSGVLAEVGEMRSDYVQRIYMQKLLERENLSPALVKQAVELAAQEIDSDYELATLLIAFSKKYSLNDETRTIFINATNTIDSDYEQRRVLATALASGQLRGQDVSAMLQAAENISSDYERAQLLLGLAQKYKLDPSMRTSYLAAASSIRSDYEKRRVYDHLIKQGNLSNSELANVLQYASSMSSDYEKAQLLMQLNQFDLSDAALQRAYLDATTRISSDYEHRRVLSSLLEKEKLTAPNLDLVLRSAVNIDSDYELAQLLLQVLKNHSLNEQQRAAFMKALNSISSSHEYGRVASALLKSSN